MTYSIHNHTPTQNSIAWSGASISYDGVVYSVADASTSEKFVYWQKATPTVFATSPTQPTLTDDDCIVFVNNGGIATNILNASVVDGSLIVTGTVHGTAITAETITATQIAAHSITADKVLVTELSALNANMGTITAGNLTLDSSGFIRGGQEDYAVGTGFWMGKHEGVYKLSVGSPANGMTFDGGALSIGSNVIIAGKTAEEISLGTRNTPRGTWQLAEAYLDGDLVLDDGSTWVCVLANTSSALNKPPVYPFTQNSWWMLFASKGDPGEGGNNYDVEIQSTNGTIFRVGQARQTTLIAHVFRNGINITAETSETKFQWTRVSLDPLPYPDDDASWNASYVSGYKQITVDIDEIFARATFHCTILE
jgi:hypothetical protein